MKSKNKLKQDKKIMKNKILLCMIVVMSMNLVIDAAKDGVGADAGKNAGVGTVQEISAVFKENYSQIEHLSEHAGEDLGKNFGENFGATSSENLGTVIESLPPVVKELAIITTVAAATIILVDKGCRSAYNGGAAVYDWWMGKTDAARATNEAIVAEQHRKQAEELMRTLAVQSSIEAEISFNECFRTNFNQQKDKYGVPDHCKLQASQMILTGKVKTMEDLAKYYRQ